MAQLFSQIQNTGGELNRILQLEQAGAPYNGEYYWLLSNALLRNPLPDNGPQSPFADAYMNRFYAIMASFPSSLSAMTSDSGYKTRIDSLLTYPAPVYYVNSLAASVGRLVEGIANNAMGKAQNAISEVNILRGRIVGVEKRTTEAEDHLASLENRSVFRLKVLQDFDFSAYFLAFEPRGGDDVWISIDWENVFNKPPIYRGTTDTSLRNSLDTAVSSNQYTTAFGYMNEASALYSTVVGAYGNSPAGTLFSVGMGQLNDPLNAFSVMTIPNADSNWYDSDLTQIRANGVAIFNTQVIQKELPIIDQHLTNKKYVDDEINKRVPLIFLVDVYQDLPEATINGGRGIVLNQSYRGISGRWEGSLPFTIGIEDGFFSFSLPSSPSDLVYNETNQTVSFGGQTYFFDHSVEQNYIVLGQEVPPGITIETNQTNGEDDFVIDEDKYNMWGSTTSTNNTVSIARTANFTLTATSNFNFTWAVSSEYNRDYFGYAIYNASTNAKVMGNITSYDAYNAADATTAWSGHSSIPTLSSNTLAAGTYYARFIYAKDDATADGEDRGWFSQPFITKTSSVVLTPSASGIKGAFTFYQPGEYYYQDGVWVYASSNYGSIPQAEIEPADWVAHDGNTYIYQVVAPSITENNEVFVTVFRQLMIPQFTTDIFAVAQAPSLLTLQTWNQQTDKILVNLTTQG